ncbi:LytTR family transcriptional regulator DNA-binding domain-containing protein [Deferribacter autotrophicus]|uniref:LytTR family transcriptional regulator DNA-binding domain-containing protein n=1 Tax=Deferribacter autotrophicus TaxID=500465 RepID=UPI003CCC5D2F
MKNSLKSIGFFRTHKSYLINLQYLSEMECEGNKCQLILKTPKKTFIIPLSRRNKTKLKGNLSIR